MSLSLISYFICLKASNQSDLMQHNVPAAIFHLAQYSVCGSRRRCRRGMGRVARHGACGAAWGVWCGIVCGVFLCLPFLPCTAPH